MNCCMYCHENKTGKIEVLVCSNNCLNYFHIKCTSIWIRSVTPFRLPDSITEEELKNCALIHAAKNFDTTSVKCPNERCNGSICLLISNYKYFETIKNNRSLYDLTIEQYSELSLTWQRYINAIKNFYFNELAWRVIPDKSVRRLCKSCPDLSKGENYQYKHLYKKYLPFGSFDDHITLQKEGKKKHAEALRLIMGQ